MTTHPTDNAPVHELLAGTTPEHTPTPIVADCTIGSCQRHQECMYRPCRAFETLSLVFEPYPGEFDAILGPERASSDLAAEVARLRVVNDRLVEAIYKIMPIRVEDGPDYATVYFGGVVHSTQAMTLNPDDWRDLAEAIAIATAD